jgi:hypothetical protein
MRVQLVALALLVGVAPAKAPSADVRTPTRPVERTLPQSFSSQFLERLGINLISKAHAAQCTEEAETCTSTEQCCPGLECTGGPPATCATED